MLLRRLRSFSALSGTTAGAAAGFGAGQPGGGFGGQFRVDDLGDMLGGIFGLGLAIYEARPLVLLATAAAIIMAVARTKRIFIGPIDC